ncbi:hypothetical protein [Nocardia sp. NPDC050710]|uniref:hypothetical protein n=1 Tax=Nocardia sp. NPDC050710 TaxID=3157220 RepID=UPI0033E8E231
MSVGGRERARAPLWFVCWMVLVIGVVAVLCLALCWVIASQGTQTTKVVLWIGLVAAGSVAALFGLLGLVRYRAVQLCLAAPVLIGTLAALVWFEIPERTGWEMSRGILEDQAVTCTDPGHRTRLGVYAIRYIARRDGGCLFYIEGSETNSEGFGYFPDTPPPYLGPPAERGIGYRIFHTRWYRFVDNS